MKQILMSVVIIIIFSFSAVSEAHKGATGVVKERMDSFKKANKI